MGMPCEINSILKAKPEQGYPEKLVIGKTYKIVKNEYRLLPIDVPIQLVDQDWFAHADIIIHQLTWQKGITTISFTVSRIYDQAFLTKT